MRVPQDELHPILIIVMVMTNHFPEPLSTNRLSRDMAFAPVKLRSKYHIYNKKLSKKVNSTQILFIHSADIANK